MEQLGPRRCSKCGGTEPDIGFYAKKRRDSWCIACNKKSAWERYHQRSTIQALSLQEKTCTKCGERKRAEDFYPDCRKRDGLQSNCKACRPVRKRHADPKRAEYMKWYFLRATYGITQEQYSSLLRQQGGVCRICKVRGEYAKKPGKTVSGIDALGLCVDHDHITGNIRGLLCNNCNRALGLFGDRADLLEVARVYLTTCGANLEPAVPKVWGLRVGSRGPRKKRDHPEHLV